MGLVPPNHQVEAQTAFFMKFLASCILGQQHRTDSDPRQLRPPFYTGVPCPHPSLPPLLSLFFHFILPLVCSFTL